MDSMNQIVAKNIKRLREKNKMSMDELSKLSGVSKSMLAQIERGEGNPTLSTLWKISNGMKVPFDALTVRPENPYELVKTSELQPLLEDGGKVKNYPIFPDDDNRANLRSTIWNWMRGAIGNRNRILKEPPNLLRSSQGSLKLIQMVNGFPLERGKTSGLRLTAYTRIETSGMRPRSCT